MNFRTALSVLLCGILLTCSVMVFGQGIVTGSISGTVQDAGKAVIAGAKVTAKEISSGKEFSTVANEVGFFTLRSISIGTYSVTIEAQGFEKLVANDVTVNAGKDTTLGSKVLSVGSASEVITVEGTAPLVDGQGAQITSTIDSKRIEALPIGNGFDSLALFTPGIVSTGQGRFGNTNGANISANGQRSRSNNFQIDGQANNDPSVTGPSIFLGNQDVIAEFQVVTNYGAEYGRNTGAVVNYVTKSGTNSFHGTAFEFLTPSTFDSFRNQEKNPLLGFCAKGQDPVRDKCTQPVLPRETDNRFGGTIGGPIVKNKAWFFGSYFEERDRAGQTPSTDSAAITPTAAGLQSLISAFPNSKAIPFLKNVAPAAVTTGNPTFTNTGTVNVSDGTTTVPVEFGNITRFVPSFSNDREMTGRADYQISDKDHVFGRYVYQKNNTTVAAGVVPSGAWVDVPGIDQQIGLDWVRTFTSTFTNQLRSSYSRANFGFQGGSFSNCTMVDMTVCPTSIAFRTAGFTGMGLQNNLPQGRITNNYTYQDNATWVRGRHTLKLGGEYDRQRDPSVFLANINGSYTFQDWNAFIQNKPFALSLVDGPPKVEFKENDYALYFQDDFRLRSNLTVNAGLRWEMYGNSMNVLHDLSVARQTSASPIWSTALPLSATTVPAVPSDRNNFGPVLGFSWSPRILKPLFGEDKSVIRGGFRIAYDAPYQNIFSNVAGSTPFVNSATLCVASSTCANVVPGLTLGSGFSGADVRAANLGFMPSGVNPGTRDQTTVDSSFRDPYSQQWNIGWQRYVSSKSAFEARYVGSRSVALFQSHIGNPYLKFFVDNGHPEWIPQGLTMCSDATQPGFGFADCSRKTVFERSNTGWSRYDALQTRFDISNWHGLTSNLGYTYSRNLDNSSEVFNTAGIGELAFNQNPFNPNDPNDAGNSSISYPHVFTANFNYELPWFKGQSGMFAKVLGGWQWNTTYRYSSGEAYTPIQRKQSGVNGFCDPQNQLSTTTDSCRPIVSNPNAQFNTVAQLESLAGGGYQLRDMYTNTIVATGAGVTDAMKGYYWLVNNPSAANFFNSTPWALGVARNSFRGDPINSANMSVYKNTKLNERFNMQLQFTAYNVFNKMYLGVPANSFGTLTSGPLWARNAGLRQFGTNQYNSSGAGIVNATYDGIGRRRMSFGAKLIF